MGERPQEQQQEERVSDKIIEPRKYPLSQVLGFGASTLAVGGIIDLAAHLGPTGLVVGLGVAYVAARHGPELAEKITDMLPSLPTKSTPQLPPASNKRSL